ncbi:MAG: hypothetical protein JNJ70_13110 [Verrucomicrobiales bacterium]|nr:hypothetical protein [Verrucomicrobiales bacterium]
MPDANEEKALARELFRRLQIEPEDLVVADRPDIRFRWQGRQIGLEITKADPEEYRRIVQFRGHEGTLDVGNLHDEHGRRRTNDELRNAVTRIGAAWTDVDIVWGRWVRTIRRALETKLEKLAKPSFECFDENWLLIAGVTGPANNEVDYCGASEALARELSSIPRSEPSFHAVYIHFESYLYQFRDGLLQLNHQP